MKINVKDQAHAWFKMELALEPGDAICFHARYGGSSPLHEGFSLGLNVVEPKDAVASVEIEGILYYIESNDEWFFDGHDLIVQFDEERKEPRYEYTINE